MRFTLPLIIVSLAGCGPELMVSRPIGAAPDGKVNGPAAAGLAVVTSQPQTSPSSVTHVVVAGDTLYSLARRYETSVDVIVRDNALADPRALKLGMTLRMPGRKAAPADVQVASAPSAQPRSAPSDRYPLRWPVEGPLTSRFGQREGRSHDGIDIGAPEGSQVVAAAPGQVVFSARHEGYGNLVVVRHRDGLVTVYAHNSINVVRKGQEVRAGQLLGKVGQTGRASGPHLHFEVRRGVKPQNPLQFLPP